MYKHFWLVSQCEIHISLLEHRIQNIIFKAHYNTRVGLKLRPLMCGISPLKDTNE